MNDIKDILDSFSDLFDLGNTVNFISSVWELVPNGWKITISIAVIVLLVVGLIKITIELL